MNFLKKYWKILVFVVILGIAGYYIVNLNKENDSLHTQHFVDDSLKQIYKTGWEHSVLDYRTAKDAMLDLEAKNKQLADTIKNKNESIKSYTQIIAQFKNQSYTHTDSTEVFTEIHDTIQVPIGQDTVRIHEKYFDILSIDGATWIFPMRGYKIDVTGNKMIWDIVLTETKSGEFNSYLDTHSSALDILTFNTRIVPYVKTFWENINFLAMASFSNQFGAISFGASYKGWGLAPMIGYNYSNGVINNSNIVKGLSLYKIF